MRILLNAYACEPNQGSEPGVGWHWAIELSKDKNNEVHVLTRANNKSVIDEYWHEYEKPNNLYFHYYDLPNAWIWLKHHGLPVNIYYSLWLYGAGCFAKTLNDRLHFDMAHHLTFGVFRDACFLYKLNIPYVVGPIGGGEAAPHSLTSLFSFKERVKECTRSLANALCFLNPFLYRNYNKASLILSKTQDTKHILKRWQEKTVVSLEIGINELNQNDIDRKQNSFLYVGRFTYWKGYQLALMAFKKYYESHPHATLKMIGRGDIDKIKEFAKRNNLQNQIEVIPWVEQSELKKYYATSSAMIFPSMHDSSGNVVLEALSFGLPVVCLDCGGPATILGETLSNLVVSTKQKSVEEIVNGIVSKMEQLQANNDEVDFLQKKCLERAKQMLWKDMVLKTYKMITNKIF